MNSVKTTIPFILLTLSACNAAPAALNPVETTTSDVDNSIASPTLDFTSTSSTSSSTPTSPMLGYETLSVFSTTESETSSVSSTVTPTFTWAVLPADYYSDPTPVAAPEDLDVESDTAPPPEPAFIPDPSLVATSYIEAPTETYIMSPVSEPTLWKQQDPATTSAMHSPSTSSTSDPETTLQHGAATLPFGLSATTLSFSVPTSQTTLFSTGTHVSPTSIPTPLLPPSDSTETESPATQLSRKAAIIGTILAVGSLLGLGACAFCTRCRLSKRLKRSSAGDNKDEHDNRDPEKALLEKTATASPTHSSTSLPLPILTVDAPTPSQSSTPIQDQPQWNGQQHPVQQNQAQVQPGGFEDVTHILSDANAFAPLPGSERSSAVSNDSASSLAYRESKGAASVKAESYATCESRYSHPSVKTNEQTGSSNYLSMSPSPSRSPSPPESPVLRTPTQPSVCTVIRTRSKTLTQPSSPRVTSEVTMSSSKSFPERYSGRMSSLIERMDGFRESKVSQVSQESEWDIAAAYGARSSKASSAVARLSKASSVSVLAPTPEVQVVENVETVDIGGKSCLLVTGYAF